MCTFVIKIFNLSKKKRKIVNIVLLIIELFTSKSNATVRIKILQYPTNIQKEDTRGNLAIITWYIGL